MPAAYSNTAHAYDYDTDNFLDQDDFALSDQKIENDYMRFESEQSNTEHGNEIRKISSNVSSAFCNLEKDSEQQNSFYSTAEQQYIHDISGIPVLSTEEERELTKAIELGNYANATLEVNESQIDDAIREQLNTLSKEGEAAKQKLIQHNLKLVVCIARYIKFTYALNSKVELLDLIQEGNNGLMHAVNKYDTKHNTRFSTYASYWIRMYINMATMRQGRIIYLPLDISYAVVKVKNERNNLSMLLERDPTIDELKVATGLPDNAIRFALKYETDALSYDNKNKNRKQDSVDISFVETLSDHVDSTVKTAEAKMVAEELYKAMERYLSKREYIVVSCHYGLQNTECMTLEAIGNMLGYTRERIRQIEVEALKKLKNVTQLKALSSSFSSSITDQSVSAAFGLCSSSSLLPPPPCSARSVLPPSFS